MQLYYCVNMYTCNMLQAFKRFAYKVMFFTLEMILYFENFSLYFLSFCLTLYIYDVQQLEECRLEELDRLRNYFLSYSLPNTNYVEEELCRILMKNRIQTSVVRPSQKKCLPEKRFAVI